MCKISSFKTSPPPKIIWKTKTEKQKQKKKQKALNNNIILEGPDGVWQIS